MNNHKSWCQMSALGWAASVPAVCTCDSKVDNKEEKCTGAHCKCMNLDKKCANFHYGDHECPFKENLSKCCGVERTKAYYTDGLTEDVCRKCKLPFEPKEEKCKHDFYKDYGCAGSPFWACIKCKFFQNIEPPNVSPSWKEEVRERWIKAYSTMTNRYIGDKIYYFWLSEMESHEKKVKGYAIVFQGDYSLFISVPYDCEEILLSRGSETFKFTLPKK